MTAILPAGALALLLLVAGIPTTAQDAAEPSLALAWTASIDGRADAIVADREGAIAVSDRGEVAAFDVQGDQLWSVDVAGEGESTYYVTPSIGADVAAIPVDDRRIVVLERGTGAVRWAVGAPGVSTTAIGMTAEGAGVVASIDESGSITTRDVVGGTPLWTATLAPVDSDNGAPHLWFRAGLLVVQWLTDGDIVRFTVFDAGSGAVAWDRTLVGTSTVASVTKRVVSFAELYAAEGRKLSVAVRSLDLTTGQENWDHELVTESPFFPTFAGAAAQGVIAIVDLDGTIRAFDADDGRLRWKSATERKQFEAQLRIAGGVLAMSTYSTGLVALSTRDGEPVRPEGIGPTQLGVTVQATAAADDRLYLLVTRNGEDLYENGEVWSLKASR